MSCLLWLLFPFTEFCVKEKSNFIKTSSTFSVLISSALLQSIYFNFLRSFQIILFLTNFTQLTLNRYEKATPFMEFSVNGKKYFRNDSYKFFVIIAFALLQSNYFNFLRTFQSILYEVNFTQKPSLCQNEKVTLLHGIFRK